MVSLLLLSFSILSRHEFLLGKSIGSSINLTGFLFSFIFGLDGLLERGSLLLNLVVPEFRVVLVTNILIKLKSDLIWGNSVVDIVKVNSLDLGLNILVLGKLLSLLSLLSLLLGLLLDGLSLGILSSFLGSDLILLFGFHDVLKLISLLLNHGVPFLGVVMVIRYI